VGLIRPTTGCGTSFGKDIVDIRTNIGYLPQDAHLYEHMTARKRLRFKARVFLRDPKSEIEKRIDERT